MNKIYFSQDELKACSDFAEQADTTYYAKRNQFDSAKRKADTNIGKLGEVIVFNSLINLYPDLSYPDFKIYKAREKSWDYDLKCPKVSIHVKSQESLQAAKFSESWIFQNQDKHIFKEYKENDYVAFVHINFMQKYGIIRNILPVKLLHEKSLFKKPVLAKLFDKSAIYYEDIKDLENCLICCEK